MGRKRNRKLTGQQNIEIDNSTTKKIVLDIEHRVDNYDDCNAFVLPNKKRNTKNLDKKVTKVKFLSKKHRKELEKIVQRKEKKLKRSELLENLTKVEAKSNELKQYVGLMFVQNKGLKRYFQEVDAPVSKVKCQTDDEIENDAQTNINSKRIKINTIKGNKKKRLAIVNSAKQNEQNKTIFDPNVVGFENFSDSSDDDISDNITTPEIIASEKNEVENIVNEKNEAENVVSEKNEAKDFKKDKNNETIADNLQKLKKPVEVQQTKVRTPAVFVPINRKPEIQEARLKLPIVAEEQLIIEKINENPIVILTGETGSGKTTQVPQFLYEAGYAQNKMIGITEPRRVAAISMSKRVAEEMNLTKEEVSYLIRFEGNVTDRTKIKFMTDGVLLREFKSDFLLSKYSVIILDEAHERSICTDILLGFLSRIVLLRTKRNDPLKLIIMSATLSVEEFVQNTKLFRDVKPPVITIEARQFPVTIYFNKKTEKNYVNEAIRKTKKIHTRLPEGGILIFLTGQQEVHTVVQKLRKAFPVKKNYQSQIKLANLEESKTPTKETTKEESNEEDYTDDDFEKAVKEIRYKQKQKKKQIVLPTINLDDYSSIPFHDGENLDDALDDTNSLDEYEDEDEDIMQLANAQPLWVLPLYSLLPSREQAKVFKPPPKGCRLCVVSTNVAETSLTIPNIRYVVDSGYCKTKVYDKMTGVNTYQIGYTSKAAASQRAGRAGRTAPGYCYRLYSSAVYNDQFQEHSEPEIRRKPLDDLLLQMKAMGVARVVNFPFPTPPDIVQLKTAEERLVILGALQQPKGKEETYCTRVTSLGRCISAIPVAPRYGKMLALSNQHKVLKYTVCIVAALTVREMLISVDNVDTLTKGKWLALRNYWAGTGNKLLLGDPMVLLKAIRDTEYAGFEGDLLGFCEKHGLRYQAVIEIRKLRQQLTNEINLNIKDLDSELTMDPKMLLPTDTEAKLLRQIVLAGMVDQVAKKVEKKPSSSLQPYRTSQMKEEVFMHSSCALQKISPEWVVYQEIYESKRMYMRGVTAIEPEWLLEAVPTLCNLSEPLSDPPPRYDRESGKIICRVSGTFGKAGWQLPQMDIEHPLHVNGVKWFACFFLEGQVCPKLKQFEPFLINMPNSIIKPWAKLIPRIEAIIQPLMSHGIMSKDKLLEIWDSDKTFLLSAYQKWLPETKHIEAALLWPPL